MTIQHKEALAVGREQSRAVRRYLEALEQNRPKRGRKRTTESVERQLRTVVESLKSAEPLRRLNLLQKKRDLEAELGHTEEGVDIVALERDFVAAAAAYGARKGISYASWREVGVDSTVLRRAGIARTRTLK
ncbi:MAG: hypothetical protein ACRD0I_02795 [Acidimicrobiales bacterium]